MKKVHVIETKYKKGELYSPDDVEDLPKDVNNQYFEDYELNFNSKHEMGTVKCTKSFKIIVQVWE